MEKESKNVLENRKPVERGILEVPMLSTQDNSSIIVDPFGSWTGVPVENPLDDPIQDVDDL